MIVKTFQFKVVDGDVQANLQRVETLFKETDLKNTDVVVLPEMWTSGYDLNNIEAYAAENLEPIKSKISKLASGNNVTVVAGSIPNKYGNSGVYNTAFIIDSNGELIHEYSKMHLVPMLNEQKYLISGDKPIEVFDIDGVPCGVLICYDLRFPEVFRDLSLAGAKIIFVVAEWPRARTDHWITLLKARAIENQCYIVASNTVDTQSNGTTFAGNSMTIDPFGKILAEANQETDEVITAELDLNYIDKFARKSQFLRADTKTYIKICKKIEQEQTSEIFIELKQHLH